jgi:hypothetical protein
VSNNLALDLYLGLNNYLNSWKRIGFSDEDITQPGSASRRSMAEMYECPIKC